MYLCQRRHFFRIVGDESRLDVSTFAEFSEDFIDAYIELKNIDVDRLRMTPHPVEYEMYYSV